MKNVLILSSSPRRGGNSDTLCDEFMQGAIESGHRVEKVFLRDKTIHPCTGCGVCSQYKKPCPQKDDAAEIIGKMLAADVIVMATPVYFYAMSAQMKTLIDRCCGPYTEMKNKEFYFIATAAEDDNGIMDRIVANFMGFLDLIPALMLGRSTDCMTLSLQIKKNHIAPAPATTAVKIPMPTKVP